MANECSFFFSLQKIREIVVILEEVDKGRGRKAERIKNGQGFDGYSNCCLLSLWFYTVAIVVCAYGIGSAGNNDDTNDDGNDDDDDGNSTEGQ